MKFVLSPEWKKSLYVTFVVFIVFSFYLFLRRGYYDLYIINKVFGSTATILGGLTLVIGPLARYSGFIQGFLLERKHLGIIALYLALLHFGTSFFLLSDRFPLSWYLSEWIPIMFGVLALSIWIFLFMISRQRIMQKLGEKVWRLYQSNGGKIAFLAIYLHLVVMKYQGWIMWFNGQVKASPVLANPTYPPASIFVFLFMTSVIVYRLVVSLRK